MTKITASEARKLAGPTVQERVDEVYPLIREAQKKVSVVSTCMGGGPTKVTVVVLIGSKPV